MSTRSPDRPFEETGGPVYLTPALRDRLCDQARQADPQECCGLLIGQAHAQSGWIVTQTIPSPNRAADPETGFEIDLGVHFKIQRDLRGTAALILGCYHSHPNGPPAPSRRDRDGMVQDGFLWLIMGVMAACAEAPAQSRWTMRAYCAGKGGVFSPAPILLQPL